ncbi:MAG: hypothetical protein AABX53_02470 [Nanoarchaeota archaeon]
MIDVQKVNATKEKILNVIKTVGPSFPTRISREAGISPLFIGALLSEMLAEKKVMMSAMKVGSSPLYFLPGQEAQLENFTQYLNHKEREAVSRLKDSLILDDETQDPAIRVALRKLKDFAIPITVHESGTEKLFWKFFTTSDERAKEIIEPIVTPKQHTDPRKNVEETPQTVQTVQAIKEERREEEKEQMQPRKVEKKEKAIKKAKEPSAFTRNVKEYLAAKEIEVLEDLPTKAKEYNARVRIDTLLGKQEYLLLAKEKKKLTEDDLAIALHKAQSEKMPALILTPGELDKTAKPYLDQWKNLLKLEKLKP